MSKPISLFSGYSQKENRITNYVLLMLRLLYEENPRYLSEVLGNFLPEDISSAIGVSFNQQVKKVSSVPDGIISQKAFTVYVEAKNHDWFYDSQLENHLEGLNLEGDGAKVLVVLARFEADLESRFESITSKMKDKYGADMHFAAVSYEDFINALNSKDLRLPKTLQDHVAEIEYFFNEQNLLPKWKGLLDVVNCTGSIENVLDHGVYLCPTQGGAYSHQRCKYFGAYRRKVVSHIAEIRAIVDVDHNNTSAINWANSQENSQQLLDEATHIASQLWPGRESARVFLLGQRYETNFTKDSQGGMQQSKLYFDVSSLNAEDAAELADKLMDRTWSDFR